MSDFKCGDMVVRVKDRNGIMEIGTLCKVISCDLGCVVVKGRVGSFEASYFKLATFEYPNPQHKHADVIIEWAKGANIEFWSISAKDWTLKAVPRFFENCIYRVAPTKAEIRIAKIQAKIDSRQIQIDAFRVKIDALKTGGSK